MARTYNDKMFIETFEHQYTWLNGFMRNVRRYGSKQALLDPITNRKWTYIQLNQEANRAGPRPARGRRGQGRRDHDRAGQHPGVCVTYIAPGRSARF